MKSFNKAIFLAVDVVRLRTINDLVFFLSIFCVLLFILLQELYDHMNSSLGGTLLEGSQVYLGKWLFCTSGRDNIVLIIVFPSLADLLMYINTLNIEVSVPAQYSVTLLLRDLNKCQISAVLLS